MGQAATKVKEAHAQKKLKPKNNKSVQQQKIRTARSTGTLALSECKLKRIPDEVWSLQTLRTLELSQNKLELLPDDINALTCLKVLKLQSNALTTLPDLSKLTSLTTLVLDNNHIQSLPHALPPNLTKLSLRNNQLTELPASICYLTQLRELDVSENAIAALPSSMETLVELEELQLDGNQLRHVPSSVALCRKLKVLSVRSNQLTNADVQCVAVEILRDSSVYIMNLEGNPALTKQQLEHMDGIHAFMERRTIAKNKEIHGGLDTDVSLCGLD